jgi:hypothetical protein
MWITRASHSRHATRVIRTPCSPAQVEDAVAAHRRLLWLLVLSRPDKCDDYRSIRHRQGVLANRVRYLEPDGAPHKGAIKTRGFREKPRVVETL